MQLEITNTNSIVRKSNVYVGIDHHLKSWKVTVLLEHSPFKTFSMDPSAASLKNYLTKHFPEADYYSVYEAGFCGFSVHRELEDAGITNIVVNPADVPTTDKERKQKEDKRDSRKLARSLRSGELSPIFIPSKTMEEFRGLIRYRKTLVKEIARNKCRIKSLLYQNGIKIPLTMDSAAKYWSGNFTQWLRQIKFNTPYMERVLQDLVETSEYLRKKLLAITRHIQQTARTEKYASMVSVLCSIPGIGLITAATLLSEIEDIHRFGNTDKLCSFAGLIPSTHTSGEHDKSGPMIKRANKPLRGLIIEAAWIASRNDPSLALSFNELCKRMKKNQAIVRIAKKLLARVSYVMKNEREYQFL